jgi:uncharacterized protein YkwD
MRRMAATLASVTLALAALVVGPAAPAASLSALVAPAGACPGTGDADAPSGEQGAAMLCMTNFARRQAGLGELDDAGPLDRSAWHKSGDILRCDSFSHEACGRTFTYWMERVGYLPASCWRAAENIAWGEGAHGTVRSIFSAWIHSPGHRENILGPYRQIGIGLRVGGFQGQGDAQVWTQEFGIHC